MTPSISNTTACNRDPVCAEQAKETNVDFSSRRQPRPTGLGCLIIFQGPYVEQVVGNRISEHLARQSRENVEPQIDRATRRDLGQELWSSNRESRKCPPAFRMGRLLHELADDHLFVE